MSELKAFDIVVAEEYYCEGTVKYRRAVYDKSEADKVIAELKAQKAQAEDDCAYWKMNERNAAKAMLETEEYAMQLYNEARHQKYKRCLAMAKWCNEKWLVHNFAEIPTKLRFYDKWEKRWLELSEVYRDRR